MLDQYSAAIFCGDTELNASIWHGPTVRALRVELLLEHLGVDTAQLDDAAALRLYRERGRKNAATRSQGGLLDGLAFEIAPGPYGCRSADQPETARG